MRLRIALLALATFSGCTRNVLAPSAAERASGHLADGTPIVQAPAQPGHVADGSLAWRKLDNSTLYDVNGPHGADVLQGSLTGDCTYLAALASLAEVNPARIMQRIARVGVTPGGASVYRIQLYDAEGRMQAVYVDDQVLFNVDEGYRNDPLRRCPQSGKYVLWATLWQKAAAKVWQDYVFMPHNEPQSLFTLTGHKTERAMLENLTPAEIADVSRLLSQVGQGRVATVDSPPNLTWLMQKRAHLPEVGEIVDQPESQTVRIPIAGVDYYVVPAHEYSLMAVTDHEVTVRNPWGVQVGGQPGGLWTLPREAFYILFSNVNLESAN